LCRHRNFQTITQAWQSLNIKNARSNICHASARFIVFPLIFRRFSDSKNQSMTKVRHDEYRDGDNIDHRKSPTQKFGFFDPIAKRAQALVDNGAHDFTALVMQSRMPFSAVCKPVRASLLWALFLRCTA
jgi:hypothetical protein